MSFRNSVYIVLLSSLSTREHWQIHFSILIIYFLVCIVNSIKQATPWAAFLSISHFQTLLLKSVQMSVLHKESEKQKLHVLLSFTHCKLLVLFPTDHLFLIIFCFQKIERLKGELHLLDVESKQKNKHTFFVDSKKEGI